MWSGLPATLSLNSRNTIKTKPNTEKPSKYVGGYVFSDHPGLRTLTGARTKIYLEIPGRNNWLAETGCFPWGISVVRPTLGIILWNRKSPFELSITNVRNTFYFAWSSCEKLIWNWVKFGNRFWLGGRNHWSTHICVSTAENHTGSL